MNLEIGHNYLLSITENGKVSYVEAIVKRFYQYGVSKLVQLETTEHQLVCRIQDIQIVEEKGVSLNEQKTKEL